MDSLTLLMEAHAAGLRVEADGSRARGDQALAPKLACAPRRGDSCPGRPVSSTAMSCTLLKLLASGSLLGMRLELEVDREVDGQWIAEVEALPGVLAYGATRQEAVNAAVMLALRVLAEKLEHGELQASGAESSPLELPLAPV